MQIMLLEEIPRMWEFFFFSYAIVQIRYNKIDKCQAMKCKVVFFFQEVVIDGYMNNNYFCDSFLQ